MAECRILFVNVMCINQNCFEQCPKGLNWATMEIEMMTLTLYFLFVECFQSNICKHILKTKNESYLRIDVSLSQIKNITENYQKVEIIRGPRALTVTQVPYPSD